MLVLLGAGTVRFVCTKRADVQYSAIERASSAFTFLKGSRGPRPSVIAAVLFFVWGRFPRNGEYRSTNVEVRKENKTMAKGKKVLTTGEVAEICNVASRTVGKWFDKKLLKGYRIPGSKDRRIPIAELVAFMKKYEIPGHENLNT